MYKPVVKRNIEKRIQNVINFSQPACRQKWLQMGLIACLTVLIRNQTIALFINASCRMMWHYAFQEKSNDTLTLYFIMKNEKAFSVLTEEQPIIFHNPLSRQITNFNLPNR